MHKISGFWRIEINFLCKAKKEEETDKFHWDIANFDIECKNEWICNVPFNHLSLVDFVVCCILCYDGFVISSNDE